jgi:hypothetical protein
VLTALLLPTLTHAAVCVGDCDESGSVAVNELVTGVNIALGTATVDTCPSFDANGDGVVAVNELITAVNNALEGCVIPGEGLGERIFSVRTDSAPFTPSRSMFASSAVAGSNVSAGFSAGPLVLVAGEPDANGIATLVLAEDAFVGMQALDGSIACYKFFAEGSAGSIDCDGGPAPNVVATQAAGENAPPAEYTVEDGDPTGPGAAVLEVTKQGASLPAGAPVDDCPTAELDTPVQIVLTTATATATKGAKTLSLEGENFSCEEWTTEDGAGMLVLPQPAYDTRAGGDSANILRIADQ